MEHAIDCHPTYSLLTLRLGQGESVVAESGAMAAMSAGIAVRTSTRGGVLRGLKRKVLGGESFFVNTYTADRADCELRLAPPVPGDVVHYPMAGGDFYLQSGAFLASTEGVQVDTRWDGFRGFFSQGLFLLHLTGRGDLYFNAFGGIEELEVAGEHVVDNGHVVGFDASLRYDIDRLPGLKNLFFGEGLVCRFRGRGRLFVQTRKPHAFASWVHAYRPVKSRSSSDD